MNQTAGPPQTPAGQNRINGRILVTSSASKQTRRVAVLGGNRIPFARSDGAYAQASNQDMFTAVLDGLAERFNLTGQRLDMVIGGAVLKHSRDFNLMRECVLGSSLSPYTPAFDLQQACGTGLQAAIAAAVEGMGQELMNAGVLLLAVAMLAWHAIWMSQHGRELAAQMKAIGGAVANHTRPPSVLIAVVAIFGSRALKAADAAHIVFEGHVGMYSPLVRRSRANQRGT